MLLNTNEGTTKITYLYCTCVLNTILASKRLLFSPHKIFDVSGYLGRDVISFDICRRKLKKK